MSIHGAINDPHFQNLAAVLGVPYRMYRWRQEHATVPFWTLHEALEKALAASKIDGDGNRVVSAFLTLLTEVRAADPHLAYSEDDMTYFLGACDDHGAALMVGMLIAYASAREDYHTPAEIAAATGTAESGWRNKAAAGDFPGSLKKGKQWLIPASLLRARGIALRNPDEEYDLARDLADEAIPLGDMPEDQIRPF